MRRLTLRSGLTFGGLLNLAGRARRCLCLFPLVAEVLLEGFAILRIPPRNGARRLLRSLRRKTILKCFVLRSLRGVAGRLFSA